MCVELRACVCLAIAAVAAAGGTGCYDALDHLVVASDGNNEWASDSYSDGDADTDSDRGSDSAVDTGADVDTDIDAAGDTPLTAINENFDNWIDGDPRFYMSKPDQESVKYPDTGTKANIDGRDCLTLHGDSIDDTGYGDSIEAQFQLDQRTNMSGENYTISFDVYVPHEDDERDVKVQFGFFETQEYTPIYSKWFGEIEEDTWVTITARIDTFSGAVDYSGFEQDPEDWIFDIVRIRLIVFPADDSEFEPELRFYLDNLVVSRI